MVYAYFNHNLSESSKDEIPNVWFLCVCVCGMPSYQYFKEKRSSFFRLWKLWIEVYRLQLWTFDQSITSRHKLWRGPDNTIQILLLSIPAMLFVHNASLTPNWISISKGIDFFANLNFQSTDVDWVPNNYVHGFRSM